MNLSISKNLLHDTDTNFRCLIVTENTKTLPLYDNIQANTIAFTVEYDKVTQHATQADLVDISMNDKFTCVQFIMLHDNGTFEHITSVNISNEDLINICYRIFNYNKEILSSRQPVMLNVPAHMVHASVSTEKRTAKQSKRFRCSYTFLIPANDNTFLELELINKRIITDDTDAYHFNIGLSNESHAVTILQKDGTSVKTRLNNTQIADLYNNVRYTKDNYQFVLTHVPNNYLEPANDGFILSLPSTSRNRQTFIHPEQIISRNASSCDILIGKPLDTVDITYIGDDGNLTKTYKVMTFIKNCKLLVTAVYHQDATDMSVRYLGPVEICSNVSLITHHNNEINTVALSSKKQSRLFFEVTDTDNSTTHLLIDSDGVISEMLSDGSITPCDKYPLAIFPSATESGNIETMLRLLAA